MQDKICHNLYNISDIHYLLKNITNKSIQYVIII